MKKFFKQLYFFASVLSFSTASFAERFESENELLIKAKNGEQSAQSRLAKRYCEIGDYPQALYWMEKNAEHSVEFQLFRQMQVAKAYDTGSCDPNDSKEQIYSPNYYKAIQWYQRIAFSKDIKQHYPFYAKLMLAEIYYQGKGSIEQDGMRAKSYYQELANISDSIIKNADSEGLMLEIRGNARRRLAQMYYFGHFVRQDFEQAYYWAQKGSADGNWYAGVIVAVQQYKGQGTQRNREAAKKLMGAVCDIFSEQKACDWYQDMRNNRPLRKGRI